MIRGKCEKPNLLNSTDDLSFFLQSIISSIDADNVEDDDADDGVDDERMYTRREKKTTSYTIRNDK